MIKVKLGDGSLIKVIWEHLAFEKAGKNGKSRVQGDTYCYIKKWDPEAKLWYSLLDGVGTKHSKDPKFVKELGRIYSLTHALGGKWKKESGKARLDYSNSTFSKGDRALIWDAYWSR